MPLKREYKGQDWQLKLSIKSQWYLGFYHQLLTWSGFLSNILNLHLGVTLPIEPVWTQSPFCDTQAFFFIIVPQTCSHLPLELPFSPTYPVIMQNPAVLFLTRLPNILLLPVIPRRTIWVQSPVKENGSHICVRFHTLVVANTILPIYATHGVIEAWLLWHFWGQCMSHNFLKNCHRCPIRPGEVEAGIKTPWQIGGLCKVGEQRLGQKENMVM